jgi:hypothetical protein
MLGAPGVLETICSLRVTFPNSGSLAGVFGAGVLGTAVPRTKPLVMVVEPVDPEESDRHELLTVEAENSGLAEGGFVETDGWLTVASLCAIPAGPRLPEVLGAHGPGGECWDTDPGGHCGEWTATGGGQCHGRDGGVHGSRERLNPRSERAAAHTGDIAESRRRAEQGDGPESNNGGCRVLIEPALTSGLRAKLLVSASAA